MTNDATEPQDLLMEAWGVIANASDWLMEETPQRVEWRNAAERWRERWHQHLASAPRETA